MLRILLYYALLFLCMRNVESVQPYFPSQIVFSINDGLKTIYAIDAVNQRAYKSSLSMHATNQTSVVMSKFPNTPSDTPQASHYVELTSHTSPDSCSYLTYWSYSVGSTTEFPSHWNNGGISYEIKNYIEFQHEMIKSTNESDTEDYWYSSERCQVDGGEIYPCEEIFFKKNTDIPLRYTRVLRIAFDVRQVITYYEVISVGKPDDKYFEAFSPNWYNECRDDNFAVLRDPETVQIDVNESKNVQISLSNTPHRINGNTTVMVHWNLTQCVDCITWTPQQFRFDSSNFQEKQTLTIKRVKKSTFGYLSPILQGGGYELLDGGFYGIFLQ